MSEFSDRPFVAGSIIGLRAFAADSAGRLSGPSYGQVFTPGENQAKCLRGEMNFFGSLSASLLYTAPPWHAESPVDRAKREAKIKRAREEEAEKERRRKENHVIGMAECTCGFYAYFNGRNDYMERGRVTALIEGYGICTVGSEGFRAPKASLVAIVRPRRHPNPNLVSLLERNYPEVPFYDRKRDALAEHPLSIGHLPQPTEADFWNTGASS